jgi:ParB family chromosome partitioning protein
LAKDERRLGKGLGALLGEYLEEPPEEDQGAAGERQVPVREIRPNPFQPRSEFEPEALSGLMESIRENGLLQPLVVRPAGDRWELVAGERRWRAVKKLGWERAPAIVRDLRDEQMLVLALVENLQRESLSPLEEALGYQQLIDNFGLTQAQVAERVGKDRSTVSNTLRLLDLEGEARDLLVEGKLTAGHARALLGLEDDELRGEVAREVVRRGLSVRATERRVRQSRADGDSGAGGNGTGSGGGGGRSRDPVVRRAEQVLERALGTEVRVKLEGEQEGRIDIVFHDGDEFRRLCGVLAGDDGRDLFA